MAEIRVRNALAADLRDILELAESVGRYIGFEDELHTWLRLDPDGFFVAEYIKSNGEAILIGVCVGIALTSDRGFMGLFITREGFRGKSIGSKLWNVAKTHLGDRNIGICGIDKHYDKFREKGFVFDKPYSVVYYESQHLTLPAEVSSDVSTVSLTGRGLMYDPSTSSECSRVRTDPITPFAKTNTPSHVLIAHDINVEIDDVTGLKCSSDVIIHELLKYDGSLHGYDRTFIVKNTISWNSCRTNVAIISGRVAGYGCFRPVVTGHWLIAPLYADSVEVAERILHSLLRGVDVSLCSKGIILRIPDTNTAFRRVCEKFGFRNNDLRILSGFTKHCGSGDDSKIFSLHSTVFCSE